MCQRGFAIGRMYYAHSTSGEHYYLRMLLNYIKGATSYEHLRMLLNYIKGATSYEHLRIVDGIEHNTFKDAFIAMGLLANDNEWHQTLEEVGLWTS
jgi:hypothetical protein